MKQHSQNTYLALLHHPVYDRARRIVTTSVVNMDIHDLSRCARTYDISRFFIVTPIPEQQLLVRKILDHWVEGYGAGFNPFRKEAFERTSVASDLDEAIRNIPGSDKKICLVATGAALKGHLITYGELKKKIQSGREFYLILLGSGSGLADEIVERCDYLLEPIQGPGDYNHLSVRSAAAIILDRLFGTPAR